MAAAVLGKGSGQAKDPESGEEAPVGDGCPEPHQRDDVALDVDVVEDVSFPGGDVRRREEQSPEGAGMAQHQRGRSIPKTPFVPGPDPQQWRLRGGFLK